MAVPGAHPTLVPESGPDSGGSPHCRAMRYPAVSEWGRVWMASRETAATLGSASPRNPMVATESSCSAESSLLVAWR